MKQRHQPIDTHTVEVRVRYAETDKMGVVHHAAYVVWFEEGRSSWMRALGSNYADFEAEGLNLVVSDVQERSPQVNLQVFEFGSKHFSQFGIQVGKGFVH